MAISRQQLARTPPRIVDVRTVKVVLDDDLARLYGVTTARFNQAVKRNRSRFPKDFAFQVNAEEHRILRSQSVISSGGHGGRRTRPWVFTEHGAIMAASILSSPRAIEMSVFVVRAFVRLRDASTTQRELVARLKAIERQVGKHDGELATILTTLEQLIAPPLRKRRHIGFLD